MNKQSPSPYALMQMAVDIVNDSPHPANKIAATLAGTDHNGVPYATARTNHWPMAIETTLGQGARIGSSSGTIHAEMACIIDSPRTRGASVFVTDPPCPNCMKYMAEAGIKTLYIDHKGFFKDFAQRRGDDFTHMSLRICKRAGINVYRIWRAEERLESILEIPEEYYPPIQNPAIVHNLAHAPSVDDLLKDARDIFEKNGAEPLAICRVTDTDGDAHLLSAGVHPIIGYTWDSMDKPDGKYSFNMQPINRLITNAARKGMVIDPCFVWSSRVPTSRELVNMIGAELSKIYIHDQNDCRDEHGLVAVTQLVEAGVLTIK